MMQNTSLQAYLSVDHRSMREKVLKKLAERGASTCDELEIALEGKHQSVSATLTAARKSGLIVDTGQTRPTRSGRSAIVWDLKSNYRVM
tara:strand:+ start:404 stop:670 length:267 start_codon:yes stop_codon:yes gene_type:complete